MSSRKPSKTWVNVGDEFYRKSMKRCLDENKITMYSTHNKVKFVVPKQPIRELKNKFMNMCQRCSKCVH